MLSESKKWNDRIKFLRLNHQMSQKTLAQMVGVDYRSVQRWEAGEAMPYPDTRAELARIFGVDEDEIFGQEEEEDPG